jgi:hypothetical protein
LAETVAETHAVMNTIIYNDNGELLPGESRDELQAAWKSFDKRFREFVPKLSSPSDEDITYNNLKSHGLTGAEGKAKRKGVWRAIDGFRAFFHSQPRTDEKRKQTAESASGLVKTCGTLVGSVPIIGEPSKEIFELTQQAIEGRMKRGY